MSYNNDFHDLPLAREYKVYGDTPNRLASSGTFMPADKDKRMAITSHSVNTDFPPALGTRTSAGVLTCAQPSPLAILNIALRDKPYFLANNPVDAPASYAVLISTTCSVVSLACLFRSPRTVSISAGFKSNGRPIVLNEFLPFSTISAVLSCVVPRNRWSQFQHGGLSQ